LEVRTIWAQTVFVPLFFALMNYLSIVLCYAFAVLKIKKKTEFDPPEVAM